MSIFNELKEYINSKNIGDTIYRKDFKSIFGSYGAGLDVYRRQLTILGYLYSIKPGQYKIKNIYLKILIRLIQNLLIVIKGLV